MNVHISKISQTSSSGEGHLSNNWANSELTNYFFSWGTRTVGELLLAADERNI